MFGLDLSEFALIGIVALLFIGPKDMPVAIRTVTNMIKKGRKLAQEFQGHVDDMLKDADLGEARDQFRQLRSFNVRGQVMKALDADGSMSRTLRDDPLKPSLVQPMPKPPVPTRPAGTILGTVETPPAPPVDVSLEPVLVDGRPFGGAPLVYPADPVADAARVWPDAADPAPSILPPGVAGRLRRERAKPLPPSFLPPRAAGGLPEVARRPVTDAMHSRPVTDATHPPVMDAPSQLIADAAHDPATDAGYRPELDGPHHRVADAAHHPN